MSFWNNPENSPFKVLLVVLVVAFAGWFAYRSMHPSSVTQERGQVLNTNTSTGAQ